MKPVSNAGTASARLRSDTRTAHTTTEQNRVGHAMGRGELPRAAYADVLRAFAAFHGAVDSQLKLALDAHDEVALRGADAIGHAAGNAAPALADLDALGLPHESPSPRGAAAIAGAVGAIAGPESDVAGLLGALYVLEGSSIGASLLVEKIRAGAGLGAVGTSYYGRSGNDAAARFARFRPMLDRALDTEERIDRAVAVANATFAAIGNVFEAIADAHGIGEPAVTPLRRASPRSSRGAARAPSPRSSRRRRRRGLPAGARALSPST